MVIRSCMKEQQDPLFDDDHFGLKSYKSLKIDSFRLSKRFEVTLEKSILSVDSYADYLFITYKH